MLTRILTIAITAICGAVPAAAQSNSLFKSSRQPPRPAPATQPASGAAPTAAVVSNPIRIVENDPDSTPPPNVALLQSSLIAVQVPKPRLFKVNDLVTVIVREDKRSQSDAKIESEKNWEVDSELSRWIRIHDHKLIPQTFPNGTPGVLFDWNDKYDGEGKNERKDSLITRVTATIIDVKPNGTLVLEDIKTIKTDEDEQILRLTGTCRSEDVTPENTVLSTQLARAKIETEHKGPSRDATKRGWIKKLVDFVNLF